MPAASKSADNDPSTAPTKSVMLTMFVTVADTTWRMFVPTLSGVGLGIWGDKTWETTPLLTILGVMVGAVLSFGLVYIQIRRVKK